MKNEKIAKLLSNNNLSEIEKFISSNEFSKLSIQEQDKLLSAINLEPIDKDSKIVNEINIIENVNFTKLAEIIISQIVKNSEIIAEKKFEEKNGNILPFILIVKTLLNLFIEKAIDIKSFINGQLWFFSSYIGIAFPNIRTQRKTKTTNYVSNWYIKEINISITTKIDNIGRKIITSDFIDLSEIKSESNFKLNNYHSGIFEGLLFNSYPIVGISNSTPFSSEKSVRLSIKEPIFTKELHSTLVDLSDQLKLSKKDIAK